MSLYANLSEPKSVLKIKSDLNRYAIDVLIHNAGYGEIGPLELVSLDKIRMEFEVNVFSSLSLSKMIIPIMRESRGGLIIHVGSSAGFISTPFNGAYAASKHALEAINDALRVELRAFNIGVVLFQAGKLKTSYQQKIIKLAGQYLKFKNPYKTSFDLFMKNEKKNKGNEVYKLTRKIVQIVEKNKKAGRLKIDFYTKLLYLIRIFFPYWLQDFLVAKRNKL